MPKLETAGQADTARPSFIRLVARSESGMNIVTVVGARPQFIKAALVSRELREAHHEVLVHTGQHYDFQMSRVFFDELGIPEPDYNLGIGSDSHARQTAGVMMSLEKVLHSEKPDIVLAYGDTNSTLAAALTASKMRVPIAHVEAGPRTYDQAVPEEINRVVTDHLSTLLFAPTLNSVDNLAKEGIVEGVHFVGDVMLDAFQHYGPVARQESRILERLDLKEGGYLYVTAHRAHNTDDSTRLASIVHAIIAMDTKVVMPVHPRTRKCLESTGLWNTLIAAKHVTVSEPVGYLDSLMLTMNARAVVTDSGGLQKEAYFASVPCVTLDTSTAWPETLLMGRNVLADVDSAAILSAVGKPRPAPDRHGLFGTGDALLRIAQVLAGLT